MVDDGKAMVRCGSDGGRSGSDRDVRWLWRRGCVVVGVVGAEGGWGLWGAGMMMAEAAPMVEAVGVGEVVVMEDTVVVATVVRVGMRERTGWSAMVVEIEAAVRLERTVGDGGAVGVPVGERGARSAVVVGGDVVGGGGSGWCGGDGAVGCGNGGAVWWCCADQAGVRMG
ncbi:hypothetical protein F0562_005633 [Nyssa sinensis]|uniref:Uncharacterized protein n=1 Tax=Nyssa sinensis TaxID=561372 RepID=A0A5J5AKW4_9ASTE|nr:hypothetical protein F0562_005633 [Nyssa sinensis]